MTAMTSSTEPLATLNARRKADREAIAAHMIAIGDAHGATHSRGDSPRNPGWRGQSISLSFSLSGVGALLSIDDLHGGEQSIISWHNSNYPSRHFSPAFNVAACDYQPRPHHKATSGGGWDLLACRLEDCLALARNGQAFISEETGL